MLDGCRGTCIEDAGRCLVGRTERYIEDTDRFPGWKGELPSPLKDSQEAAQPAKAANDSQAPVPLTMGVGSDGKVGVHPSAWCQKLPQHGTCCGCALRWQTGGALC